MNRTVYQMAQRKKLTTEDLERNAPSIFSEQARSDVSNKYAFVPTVQVIEQLDKQGWYPVNAQEQRVLNSDRKGYQKHLIKFQSDAHGEINGIKPEIILTNSHDRTSSFRFMAGLYRLVCSNGLVVADAEFGKMNVRHIGYNNEKVVEVVNLIMEQTPKVLNRLESLQQMEVNRQEQVAFAVSAAMEKWKVDENHLPFDAERLLTTRRYEDKTPSVWTTYNTVQENLMRGGLGYRTVNREGRRAKRTTRAITSINEDVRVNKALWTLAENMRRIKNGEEIINKTV
jgi:hypothetical protein